MFKNVTKERMNSLITKIDIIAIGTVLLVNIIFPNTKLVMLLSLIIFPFLMALTVIIKVATVIEPFEVFGINPDRGLFKQGIFWFCMLLPIEYFIIFGFVAWKDYSIQFDAEGLSNFIRISALPLGILSLALPLTAFVARAHASEQTARIIKQNAEKNNLDAYSSHRKELFEYFEQLGNRTTIYPERKIRHRIHPKLHKKFYTGSPKDGLPIVKTSEFEKCDELLIKIVDRIDSVISNCEPDKNELYYYEACSFYADFGKIFHLDEIASLVADYGLVIKTEKPVLTIGKTTEEAIWFYRYLADFYNNFCIFAEHKVIDIPRRYKHIQTGLDFYNKMEPGSIESLTKKLMINEGIWHDAYHNINLSLYTIKDIKDGKVFEELIRIEDNSR